jgi:hypothetical protein
MNGLNACERQNLHDRSRGMIAQNVAEIVSRHVKLTVEGIDRMYRNVFVCREPAAAIRARRSRDAGAFATSR